MKHDLFTFELIYDVQTTVDNQWNGNMQNEDLSTQMVEDAVKSIQHTIVRDQTTADMVSTMLIDCAVQIPSKTPIYALLIGIINTEDPPFAIGVLQQVESQLTEALTKAADFAKVRLLLRFVAALAATRVVDGKFVVQLLRSFVDKAFEILNRSNPEDDGRSWQPYTDYLVYMSLVALPFGSSEILESAKTEIVELVRIAQEYSDKRRRSYQPGLCPYTEPVVEDDPLVEYDSGAASFLPQVIDGVKEIIDKENFIISSIPRVHAGFEGSLTPPESHSITIPHVYSTAPIFQEEENDLEIKAARVLDAFPPRGVIRLPTRQSDDIELLKIERIIAEDYVLDTIRWFEGDHVECARQLSSLPLPYPYDHIIAEVMFGQILRLPTTDFKPVLYGILMVNLCKLRTKTFPRAISSCVRENFSRMNVMDPALRERLAEWLAYHLSNFRYEWPWSRWEHVLDAPPYDGQRRFCIAVMNRIVRLSYWEKMHSIIPESFAPILPPKPEVLPLPATDETDLEGFWAGKALEKVRSKLSADDLKAWASENDLETILGGKVKLLQMFLRCLLVAGAKSYTHMIIALERYRTILDDLVSETQIKGQSGMMATVVTVWASNPQRICMAVDRLTTLRLLSVEVIASWVFGDDGIRCISNETRSGVATELLQRAVDKSLVRVQDAIDDLGTGKNSLEEARSAFIAGALPEEEVDAIAFRLKEKESYLEKVQTDSHNLLLQVLASFVRSVSPGGFAFYKDDGVSSEHEENGMDFEASAQKVLNSYMIQSLISFMRLYHLPIAPLYSRIIHEIIEEAPDNVKECVKTHLKL